MNTDLYTKTVLTVIAACLVWLCVNGATPAALAQAKPAEPSRVILVNERNVALATGQGLRVNVGAQALPVSITNASIAVRQPVAVRVLREPPTLMPTP